MAIVSEAWGTSGCLIHIHRHIRILAMRLYEVDLVRARTQNVLLCCVLLDARSGHDRWKHACLILTEHLTLALFRAVTVLLLDLGDALGHHNIGILVLGGLCKQDHVHLLRLNERHRRLLVLIFLVLMDHFLVMWGDNCAGHCNLLIWL